MWIQKIHLWSCLNCCPSDIHQSHAHRRPNFCSRFQLSAHRTPDNLLLWLSRYVSINCILFNCGHNHSCLSYNFLLTTPSCVRTNICDQNNLQNSNSCRDFMEISFTFHYCTSNVCWRQQLLRILSFVSYLLFIIYCRCCLCFVIIGLLVQQFPSLSTSTNIFYINEFLISLLCRWMEMLKMRDENINKLVRYWEDNRNVHVITKPNQSM